MICMAPVPAPALSLSKPSGRGLSQVWDHLTTSAWRLSRHLRIWLENPLRSGMERRVITYPYPLTIPAMLQNFTKGSDAFFQTTQAMLSPSKHMGVGWIVRNMLRILPPDTWQPPSMYQSPMKNQSQVLPRAIQIMTSQQIFQLTVTQSGHGQVGKMSLRCTYDCPDHQNRSGPVARP